jgi:uncharacterized protein
MKRILLATIFSLCASLVCVAQQSASDAPATKEDVQKYLDLMHSREMMTKMMDAMVKPMRQMTHEQYLKNKDKLPPDFEERTNKMLEEQFKALPLDEMLQAMVPVYQKHLTKNDVQALIAFYSSPTGQKLIQELPAITAEAMQAVMPVLNQRVAALNQQMQKEIDQMINNSKAGTGNKSQAKPN